MRDLFRRYLGDSLHHADLPGIGLEEKHLVYCLVKLPNREGVDSARQLSEDVGRVVAAAEAAGGDINQLLGDVVLVLFGVPFDVGNAYSEVEAFVRSLATLPVAAVVGEDTAGLYGTVGTDSRRIVTGFSRRLSADLRDLILTEARQVVVRGTLARPLRLMLEEGIAVARP